jgi:pimeloyl-ACP methyl ester carboxylesterase
MITCVIAAAPARLSAQLRLLAALAPLPRHPAPRLEEIEIAAVPATLARPRRPGRLPAFVFVNGVTARGRRHPEVRRVAATLARAGHAVLVPDPTGLAQGAISLATAQSLIAAVDAFARTTDAPRGRVRLLGVSLGTTLALLAAQDPGLRDRVELVAGIAPYADAVNVVRLATTGHHLVDGETVAYPVPDFLRLVIARTLVAWLDPGADRDLLANALAAVGDDDPDPLAAVRALPLDDLTADTRRMVDVLLNADPARFDALFARVPAAVRRSAEALSPIRAAAGLRAPVLLVSEPRDKYFPIEEARAVARLAPDARLIVTDALSHADLRPTRILDLLRLDALAVTILAG